MANTEGRRACNAECSRHAELAPADEGLAFHTALLAVPAYAGCYLLVRR